jgi:hypothetical protein
MQQLLGGGKKQNKSGLAGLAGQFLGGGGSHNQGSHQSGAGSLVGALAGSLLGGGKKPSQQQHQDYTGSQSSQQSTGFLQNLGGVFGGHQTSSVC